MRSNINGSRAAWRGVLRTCAVMLAMGLGFDGAAGGGGALRLCHEWRSLCDRHGHQHRDGHDPDGAPSVAVAVTPDGKHTYVAN